MERLFSPPTGGYPQEVPDYWRFADGTIRKDLQSLSDTALNGLGWTGPITIPVAKQVDDEGNITNEDEYTYDGETHKSVWYAKERKFVIIGKEESELPYLPNAVIHRNLTQNGVSLRNKQSHQHLLILLLEH
jgi:hypothetical protein